MAGDGGDGETDATGNVTFEQDEEKHNSVEDTDHAKQDVDGAHGDRTFLPVQRDGGDLPPAAGARERTNGRESTESMVQGEGRGQRKIYQSGHYWHTKQ